MHLWKHEYGLVDIKAKQVILQWLKVARVLACFSTNTLHKSRRTQCKRNPHAYAIKYGGNSCGGCALFNRKPERWQCRRHTHGNRARQTVQELTNVNRPGRKAILPVKKDKATPTPLGKAAKAVALVRCCTGNQRIESTGGTAIATGPAKPFRNWPKFTVLEKYFCWKSIYCQVLVLSNFIIIIIIYNALKLDRSLYTTEQWAN